VPVVEENAMVTRHCSLKRRSLSGFTLIELILVLVIVGFLISLVAPAITSTAGLNLRTAAKRIAAGLRYARSQAVTMGDVYQVVFNIEQNEMTIERIAEEDPYGLPTRGSRWWEAGEDEDEEEGAEEPAREQYAKETYRLPKGVTIVSVIADDEEIDQGEVLIDFYPNGSCTGGDVFLMDDKERTYRIALEFITGVVTIEEEET
jgi:general secretion pathway protein H